MDKLIYFFGNGVAEGDASPEMNELLGGKGAPARNDQTRFARAAGFHYQHCRLHFIIPSITVCSRPGCSMT